MTVSAKPMVMGPRNSRVEGLEQLLRSVLVEPLRKTDSKEGFSYSGRSWDDLSKEAQAAVLDSRVVEKEFFGVKRCGYLHINPDGSQGGFVELTAKVDRTAYIGINAAVLDEAWVTNDAAVFGNALVYDLAWVSQNARVFDSARVFENAKVYSNAWVCGEAEVCGQSNVLGDAKVGGKTKVRGKSWIRAGEFYKDDVLLSVFVRGEIGLKA